MRSVEEVSGVGQTILLVVRIQVVAGLPFVDALEHRLRNASWSPRREQV